MTRAVRNDAAIVRAATSLIAQRGWGAASLSAVAREAGLSTRPVYARFADRGELAVAVWRECCTEELGTALEEVLRAVDGGPELASPMGYLRSAGPFARPSSALRAAASLLVVREYEPGLRAVVDESLGPLLSEAVSPRGRGAADQAARNVYAIMVVLGLLLTAPRALQAGWDLTPELLSIGSALATCTSAVPMPGEVAAHLDVDSVYDTGEPALDRLLQAALDEMGARGFDHATTRDIARKAGVSEGFIFGRYPSKEALCWDATDRMIVRAGVLNKAYMSELARKYSAGLSDAAVTREIMRPGRELLRAINLEQFRLTWHHAGFRQSVEEAIAHSVPEVLETTAEQKGLDASVRDAAMHVAIAEGAGIALFAQLRPDAWDLPWSVVTVPLIDGEPPADLA